MPQGDRRNLSHRSNPYEDADPIPVPVNANKRARTGGRTPSRSRTVQYAQDSALRAESASARAQGHASYGSDATATRHRQPQRRHAAAQRTDRSSGFAPVGSVQRRMPYEDPAARRMRTRRKTSFGIIAAIILCAIAVLSAALWWLNRPVPITVNGQEASVRVGSTLEDVLHEERIEVTPGNYVSVSGRVIEAGQGTSFTAQVNGKELSAEDAQQYRVAGTEAIVFSDGTDVTEPFTADSEIIMPYLRMEGSGYTLQYVSQWGYAGELQHRVGKETGETADVMAREAQDCVITCRDPYIEGDRKVVALTFDDGPAETYTDQYLEILARYNVKATFFNLGDNVQSFPEVAQRVVAAGHQVCNHTMAHNQLTAVDGQTVYSEITSSAQVIEEHTGVHTSFLRPPYGDFTERSWLGSGGTISASIRWSGDSRDWALPGVDAILENSLINLHSGTIILMHDGGGDRSQDVEALPILIERLQAEGYEFVTISGLLDAMGDVPEDVCDGTSAMPEDAVWPEEIHPDDLAAAAAAQ